MSAVNPFHDSPVPDAVGRVLEAIRARLDVNDVDRVWIFPPLIRGRREWGLVAVSAAAPEPELRTLFTARYSAELKGSGTSLDFEIFAQGDISPDRLPRVMDGVARRSDLQLGDAREVEVEGDLQLFDSLVEEHGGVREKPLGREKEA